MLQGQIIVQVSEEKLESEMEREAKRLKRTTGVEALNMLKQIQQIVGTDIASAAGITKEVQLKKDGTSATKTAHASAQAEKGPA